MCAAVARPDPFSRNHLIPEPVFALVTSREHEPWRRFPCPFLAGEVELTAEREAHILERHPELCVVLFQRLRETLHAPDAVRPSGRSPNALEFLRWYPVFPQRKWVVVIVISDPGRGEGRHWIITAYVTK
jgi:hypothetical protein